MAHARPLPLIVLLAAGLGAAWLLGRGDARPVELAPMSIPPMASAAHEPDAPGPVLAGMPPRARTSPVIADLEAWPRCTQSPSGASEVHGVVIDEHGHGHDGGVVRAVRLWPEFAVVGEAPVVAGHFRLTVTLDELSELSLMHRDAPHWASYGKQLFVRPGERWEGVELIVVAMGTLVVEVTDASGAPAPDAFVETFADAWTSRAEGSGRVTLDAQARAHLPLPPVFHAWISATSPDGRFFVREHFSIEPGKATGVALRLLGPSERLAVRVVSEPARMRSGERANVTLGMRAPVVAELDGPPCSVWLPPGEAGFHVDAVVGDLGWGRLSVGPGQEERERALRDGARVVVRLRTPFTVELVDARDRPVAGMRLGLDGFASDSSDSSWGVSDVAGRVALGRRAIGKELPLSTEWGDLGKVLIPADGRPVRVVVPDPLSVVGGVVDPTTPREVLPWAVRLAVGDRHLHAPIDATPRPEGYRWRALVPFPIGTPVRAFVKGDATEGICGQEDLRLKVRAANVEVAPRLGAWRRPRGHVRIQRLPIVRSPNDPAAVPVGPAGGSSAAWTQLEPGSYRVAWRSEGSTGWRIAEVPIEVREGVNRFEVDFGSP